MKKLLPFFFFPILPVSAQDTPPIPESPSDPAPTGASEGAEAEKPKKERPVWAQKIDNLPQEKKEEYAKLDFEAKLLYRQKRVFECLEHLHQMEEIFEGNPITLNFKGACYVEFRSFDKAREAFAKAIKIEPDNFSVRFNLAEIEFVSENYQESLERFTALSKEAEGDPVKEPMKALAEFKILLSKLKLGDEAGARKVLEGETFLSDSPLYYFGNASLEYFGGDKSKAEIWLARAGRVFGGSDALSAWQDTLIEIGYIESFYGADLEVESSNPAGDGE